MPLDPLRKLVNLGHSGTSPPSENLRLKHDMVSEMGQQTLNRVQEIYWTWRTNEKVINDGVIKLTRSRSFFKSAGLGAFPVDWLKKQATPGTRDITKFFKKHM